MKIITKFFRSLDSSFKKELNNSSLSLSDVNEVIKLFHKAENHATIQLIKELEYQQAKDKIKTE